MMKLIPLTQYMKMSKPALIRKIMKTLRAMPKKKLALACYNLTKAKLPRLRKTKRPSKRMSIEYNLRSDKFIDSAKRAGFYPPYKKKRKFSRKQLAAQRLFAKRARAGTLRKRRRR